ncbi:MAG: PKD domain-containing protein, partial [Bacteroidota bacterium]
VSNPATICIGQASTISASATGGTTPYSYTWNNGTTASSQSVSPVVTTTYFVNITDANGCTAAQQSITITVNPALAVVASADAAICEQQSATISAVGSGGNGGPYTYTWSNNASTAATTVSPMQTTTYVVQVADNCGTPVAIDSVTIIVNPLPKVLFTPLPASGCIPLEVRFADSSITANGSDYKWTFGDGQTSTDADPVHVYTEAGSYNIGLTITTPQGCVSALMLPDAVTAFPLPVAAFTTDPQKASILHPEIAFTDNSTSADYWTWDFGDNYGTSSKENTLYAYRDTGTYRITLMVENTYGCLDTSYGEVVIEGAFTIYIPNAFSPNNDGKNDFFSVYGIGIQKMDMFIFNRWGDKIFHSDNVNKPWNGFSELKNTYCKEDVYVYLVKVVDLKGDTHELKGNVTLVR